MSKPTDYAGGLYDNFRYNSGTARVNLIESFYMRQITELACNRFKWSGLPDRDDEDSQGDVRVRYLELTLFRYALAVFFKHTKSTEIDPTTKKNRPGWDKFLCLRASNPGPLDMYFDPTAFHIYTNGSQPGLDGLTVSAKEAVPIWANYLRHPELDMVQIYSNRMARMDRTVEINVDALRHPFILAANPETAKSVREFFRQVEQGQSVIEVQEAFAKNLSEAVTVLNMQVDKDLITNMLIDKRKTWTECLTFLGINNANQDKRERLVSAEVSANDSEVLATRRIALDSREEACERINKKFKLNVSVEWNVSVDDMADMPGMELGSAAAEETQNGEADVKLVGVTKKKEGAAA